MHDLRDQTGSDDARPQAFRRGSSGADLEPSNFMRVGMTLDNPRDRPFTPS